MSVNKKQEELDSQAAFQLVESGEDIHNIHDPENVTDDFQTPSPKSKNPMFHSVIFILFVELCERLAYYTFAGSFKTFLTENGMAKTSSASMYVAFNMISYVSPIVGGWLADAYWGRYKTILTLGSIYIIGVWITTLATLPAINSDIMYLVGIMSFVAFGMGGIKPNVCNFGADQFDSSTEKGRLDQESFFSYFYFCINLGSIVSFGYLTTLAQNGQGAIPKEWGFFTAYAVASTCMVIAIGTVWLLRKRFVKFPPSGDSLRGLCHYLWNSAKYTGKGKVLLAGWLCFMSSIVFSITASFLSSAGGEIGAYVAYFAMAIQFFGACTLVCGHLRNNHLDVMENHHCLEVEEAKGLLDTVPQVIIGSIGVMSNYNLMATVMFDQACQSNLMLGTYQLAGSFFQIGDCFGIVIFTPILDKVIYPLVSKLIGRHMPSYMKIISGMMVSCASLAVAVILEYQRKSAPLMAFNANCPNDPNCNSPGYSGCAGDGIEMSDFSAMWLFIPYAMIGISETMILPQLYYISYDQCPARARSISMAFNLMCNLTIASIYSNTFFFIFSSSYTSNINDGAIQVFYFTGIVLSIICAILYYFVSQQFVHKDYGSTKKERRKSSAISTFRVSMKDNEIC